MSISTQTIKKWEPIIENFFKSIGLKNKYLLTILCEYCEYHSQIESLTPQPIGSSDIPYKLSGIEDQLIKFNRVEVVGKFFNPITGGIEYKLSDGQYVSSDGSTYYIIPMNDMMNIFDMDFIHHIYPEFRSERINDILND